MLALGAFVGITDSEVRTPEDSDGMRGSKCMAVGRIDGITMETPDGAVDSESISLGAYVGA